MTHELWADIYDASGNRLGDGPVALRDAAVKRVLDGVGSVTISVPGTDARAVSLLVNENRVRVYYRPTEDGPTRELGRGIMRVKKASGTTDAWTVTMDGPDELDELTRRSVLLGRKYSATAASTIAAALTGLVTGWSATASGGNTTDARFDGMSVFKALLALAEQQGLHVRLGDSAKEVEFGAFGASAGLTLVNPAQLHPAAYANDDIALIESIHVEMNSEAVCNRLFPIGAGIGEAWLTLENATRTSPYTVGSLTGPDGATMYFLNDAASLTAYGTIEKVGRFSEIAPLSNSAADLENAANALYDISAAWLQRYSQRQDVYAVTCRKVRKLVRPGDKVHLLYKGVVVRDGAVVDVLDLNAEMWVMEAEERVGVEGAVLDLRLSTVDRHAMDSAQIVIGALEELQVDGVSVKPYFNRTSWVYDRLIAPLIPASIPVKLTNATQKLNRCLLRIKTRPFTSTVEAVTTSEPHDHDMFEDLGVYNGPYTQQCVWFYAPGVDGGAGSYVPCIIPIATEGLTNWLPIVTGVENAASFVALQYGLFEDDVTPEGIRIFIDGDDYTSALGGPWAPSGGNTTIDLDITEAILDHPPLQQEHTIRMECTMGRGEVEFTVEVYETIQSIRVI